MASESEKPNAANPNRPGGARVTRLGRYELLRKLGLGGMGAVYEAIQDGWTAARR